MHHNIPHSTSLICLQQPVDNVLTRAVGCFKLSAGRAMSLTPTVPGELRIAHGRVWLTFGNAADEAAVRAGDYFLDAGDLVHIYPGQQLVMEVYEQNTYKNALDPVYFSWKPEAASRKMLFPGRAQYVRCDVQQPLRDLGGALLLAGSALGRLAQGVAGNLACTLVRRHTAAR